MLHSVAFWSGSGLTLFAEAPFMISSTLTVQDIQVSKHPRFADFTKGITICDFTSCLFPRLQEQILFFKG